MGGGVSGTSSSMSMLSGIVSLLVVFMVEKVLGVGAVFFAAAGFEKIE
jgi:hypothetical protein